MNTITYTNGRDTYRNIPLGKDYDVKREPGDIILERGIAVDLPLTVTIQIKADGSWNWWHTETGHTNTYWHFAAHNVKMPECSEAQRQTLDDMQSGRISIFGMRGALGNPVIRWAFGERMATLAAAYHN